MGCYLSQTEMEECCADPRFCVVCMVNRDIPVDEDHVCAECAGEGE